MKKIIETNVIVFTENEQMDIIKNNKYLEVQELFKLITQHDNAPSLKKIKRFFLKYSKKEYSFSLFFCEQSFYFSYSNAPLLTKRDRQNYFNSNGIMYGDIYKFYAYKKLARKNKIKKL